MIASGMAMVDPNAAPPGNARLRRHGIRLAAAAAVVALAAGVGGWTVIDRAADPSGPALPAVVLGEALQPLAVYPLDDARQVSAEPVTSLDVRFAMIRRGPDGRSWELTLTAPDQSRSAIRIFTGRHHSFVVLFDGNQYPVGLSYPDNFDGRSVDFFVVLPDLTTASALAESLTTSVVTGPPMGSVSG